MSDYDIELQETGYYQVKNKPSQEFLNEYYANKYYQQGEGSYEIAYSDAELQYLRHRQLFWQKCLERMGYSDFSNVRLLDVGCGEGWVLSHFAELGCKVTGVDFSSFGVAQFNSHVIGNFHQEDIYLFLQRAVSENQQYDIIALANVVEHVLEPEQVLSDLTKILAPDGVLIVTFPNDFSPLQQKLLRMEKIDKAFWVSPPAHLSYFNKHSFDKTAYKLGMKVQLYLADFPVDIFLMNDHSNYIKDCTKGKQAHYARVYTMNLLAETDIEETVDAFLHFGNLGFGRDLTAFMQVTNEIDT